VITSQDERIARRERKGLASRDAVVAAALYIVLSLALTWPLAPRMTRDIAADFGDPLLNAWILAWDATHLGRGLWNANIFHPHPLTLGYSEHLLPQAIQILPLYALTKNPILCYNVLFLSTFALSGLGMFLLARELTGSRTAAFVAGLAYAFAPYRFSTLSHVQVLSSAWMPFALYGLRRYFDTDRVLPLAGGAAAWLLQNLSSGYYLLFFSPIVVLYLAWEMTVRHRWTDARTLVRLGSACAIVGLATVPFLLPYLELRNLGFSARSLAETDRYSADAYAYLTADPNLRLAGRFMRAWPKAEGALFPGFTITALAIAAIIAHLRSSAVDASFGGQATSLDVARRFRGRDRVTERMLRWLLAGSSVMLVALVFGWTLRLPVLKITSFSRQLWVVVALAAVLLAISRDARAATRRWWSHPVGLFAALTLFAIVMSFGPHIHAKGRVVADPSLYAFFYNYVPGFDGVRVPARYGMIAALGLAALAGFGVRRLDTATLRPLAGMLGILIVAESLAVPIGVNDNWVVYKQPRLEPLPPTLTLEPAAEQTYRFVAALPASSAIVELPLGEPAFDVRYMFYSTRHWKRLVNGYSGGEPEDYSFLSQSLQDVLTRPDRAWDALIKSTATHAIVHERFYSGDRGSRISEWLRSRGATEVAAFGTDRVFSLP
jgi:hypothetical protein